MVTVKFSVIENFKMPVFKIRQIIVRNSTGNLVAQVGPTTPPAPPNYGTSISTR